MDCTGPSALFSCFRVDSSRSGTGSGSSEIDNPAGPPPRWLVMNVHKTIVELRRDLQVINEVIISLERLERNRVPKRGRPRKYVDSSRLREPLRRGEMADHSGGG